MPHRSMVRLAKLVTRSIEVRNVRLKSRATQTPTHRDGVKKLCYRATSTHSIQRPFTMTSLEHSGTSPGDLIRPAMDFNKFPHFHVFVSLIFACVIITDFACTCSIKAFVYFNTAAYEVGPQWRAFASDI